MQQGAGHRIESERMGERRVKTLRALTRGSKVLRDLRASSFHGRSAITTYLPTYLALRAASGRATDRPS